MQKRPSSFFSAIEALPELYSPLHFSFDFDSLQAALLELVQKRGLRNGQLSLQHHPSLKEDDEKWNCGIAGIDVAGRFSTREMTEVHSELRGSVIEKFLSQLPAPPCRARLIQIRPKQCFPIHSDPSRFKFHFTVDAVQNGCWLVFPERKKLYPMNPDGKLYVARVEETHSVFNGSSKPRLQFVSHIDLNENWVVSPPRMEEGFYRMPP